MKHRNGTIYRARLSNLKLCAWGIDKVLDYAAVVEIYQARANPEMWRSRPMFKSGAHKWEAASAEALMELIQSDFEHVLQPWYVFRTGEEKPIRPTLFRAPDPPRCGHCGASVAEPGVHVCRIDVSRIVSPTRAS